MQITSTLARSFAAKPKIIDLRTACVAHYKMNDNAPTTTVVDSQGFSNGTAQQNTSALFTTGKVGGALTFNGTSDYVDTNNTFQSVFQGDFSINLWVNTPATFQYGLMAAASGYDSGFEIALVAIPSACRAMISYVSNGEEATTQVMDNFPIDEWAMVTGITRKISSSTAQVFLYHNGFLKSQSAISSVTMSVFNMGDTTFPIGAINDNGSIVWPLNGSIDDATLFNKALSEDEIAFLWNAGNGTEYLYGVI